MSRIGNKAIAVPKGVELSVADGSLSVKGPKGTLTRPLPPKIDVRIDDGTVTFARPAHDTKTRALHGLARALVNNMVTGVTEGFKRELEIQGVGYRANASGQTLNLLLGFSHPVEMPVPEGLSVSVEANTTIRIEGIDKQQVGQFAADIRSLRPPEPYKGKGVRYAGERVRRKVGKTGAGK
ncbi:MAG: 50S ribosomal protein L6 [Myxococcota bacterium]|nr:50S ribosomal protein L6 [Myxococcales bacterium]